MVQTQEVKQQRRNYKLKYHHHHLSSCIRLMCVLQHLSRSLFMALSFIFHFEWLVIICLEFYSFTFTPHQYTIVGYVHLLWTKVVLCSVFADIFICNAVFCSTTLITYKNHICVFCVALYSFSPVIHALLLYIRVGTAFCFVKLVRLLWLSRWTVECYILYNVPKESNFPTFYSF